MSVTQGITFRPEWGCFVCPYCSYGVRPSQVRSHWKNRHGFQGKELRTIEEYCDNSFVNWDTQIPLEFETEDSLLLLYHNAY